MNILCDDCYYEGDRQLIMKGPTKVLGWAPHVQTKMSAFQCNCGRLYCSSLGYFTLVQGEGIINVRRLDPCNSEKEVEQMYIAEVLEDYRLRLKCTTCDYERIVVSRTQSASIPSKLQARLRV